MVYFVKGKYRACTVFRGEHGRENYYSTLNLWCDLLKYQKDI